MPLHDVTLRPGRPSFADTLNQVMQQVEYHCFADLRFRRIDPLFKELCFIISEVFFIYSDSLIKVNGSDLPASLVQEVYSLLRNEHLRLVFTNFHDVSNRVYNKKAYLRTSLYNSVFEIQAHFANNSDSFD